MYCPTSEVLVYYLITHHLKFQTGQPLTSSLLYLKYLRSFLYYAENCPYYTGIMFFALQPLLCLKLCQHSRCKPTYRCKFDQFYTNNIFVNYYIRYMYYITHCNLQGQVKLVHLFVIKTWYNSNLKLPWNKIFTIKLKPSLLLSTSLHIYPLM